MSKWTWTIYRDTEVWDNPRVNSKESAIKAGRAELKDENKINEEIGFEMRLKKFYVGRCEDYIPPAPKANSIIERLYEKMYYDFPQELLENTFEAVKLDDEKLLQRKLNKVWKEWLKEVNIFNLYHIKDIEEVNVYEDKEENDVE